MANRLPPPAPGPLQKLAALIGGLALLVLGLSFSVVLLVVGAVVGLLVWAYLWWRTRQLRQALREMDVSAQAGMAAGRHGTAGQVFDGEAVVVDEASEENRR